MIKRINPLLASIVVLLALTLASTAAASEDPSSYNLLDARERGTFNIGLALGAVFQAFDRDLRRDVLKFDYTATPRTMVGVWTKGYPLTMKEDTADAVKVGVKVPNPEQLDQISVTMEIKGKKSWQKTP